MAEAALLQIHSTAIVSPLAQIADDVPIGPYCVIEGEVQIGAGCWLGPHVHLVGPLTLGVGNRIFTGAVLGEAPQHLRYQGEETRLEIGDHNIIREHVTIHRGTTQRGVTTIGSRNFLMAHCHIAHDCVVGSGCTLANGALIAGHCELHDGCIISGNATVQQHCRVGRLAMLGGVSGTTKDIPPFVIQQGINVVTRVNVVGLRRAGVTSASMTAVRTAFRVLFREGRSITNALASLERAFGAVGEIRELIDFIRASKTGINRGSRRGFGVSDGE